MRFAPRFLPAFLCLLAPLAVLAWLGSRELSRLDERAERAVRDQAFQILEDAARRLEDAVRPHEERLRGPLELGPADRVATAATLTEQDLAIRDLIVLSDAGDLVFPSTPPTQSSRALLSVGGLAPAEWLLGAGDLDGARAELENELEREASPRDRRRPPDRRSRRGRSYATGRVRAQLMLGAVLRRQGKLDEAQQIYERVVADSDRRRPGWPREGLAAEIAAATTLLGKVAIAEIEHARSGALGELIEVARQISIDAHDRVDDDLSNALLDRIGATISGDTELARSLAELRSIDAVRRHGRRYAIEFRDLFAETMRRRLRLENGSGPVFQAFTSRDGGDLLILRRPTPAEQEQLRPSGGVWIGLRLDLGFLATTELDRHLAGDDGFRVTLLDADGSPLLGDAAATPSLELASHTAIGGLRLLATPSEPVTALADGQARFRNRALLIVALCALAGAGALFLMRSVARETEVAALKVDLVSRVSHELRTPLSLIKMYGETLSLGRTRDREQSMRFAGIISREADRLTALIQRILDFSSQQGGQFTYEREAIDVSELLSTVTTDYRPHIEAANASLDAVLAPGVRADVDPNALAGVYVNLLENALKYTSPDADRTIEVELRGGRDELTLEVRDRGVGIPPAERKRVFESFYRASTAGEVRGAGLGLSLVHHFATAHGGRVDAFAREGGGTTIRVRLPIHATHESDRTRSRESAEREERA